MPLGSVEIGDMRGRLDHLGAHQTYHHRCPLLFSVDSRLGRVGAHKLSWIGMSRLGFVLPLDHEQREIWGLGTWHSAFCMVQIYTYLMNE